MCFLSISFFSRLLAVVFDVTSSTGWGVVALSVVMVYDLFDAVGRAKIDG